MLILVSAITGCVSICVFASLFDIPIGIGSSVVGFRICARIKMYRSIIKSKEKSMKK